LKKKMKTLLCRDRVRMLEVEGCRQAALGAPGAPQGVFQKAVILCFLTKVVMFRMEILGLPYEVEAEGDFCFPKRCS
jgi:hypothetical protein